MPNVFDTMAWAKRQVTGSVGAKAVLMAMAERTGETLTCFPSQVLLAAETEQSESTVRRRIRDLEELGLIQSSRRYVDAEGRQLPRGKAHNQYRLLVTPADTPRHDQSVNLTDGLDDQPVKPGSTNRSNGSDQPVTAMTGEVPSLKNHTEVTTLFASDEANEEAPPEPAPVRIIFDAWVSELGKNPKTSKLNNKRDEKIRARLNEGYTVEEMINAIKGVKLSAWHMGENQNGKKYDDIVTIFRDGVQVEKFCALLEGGGEDDRTPTQRALDDAFSDDDKSWWIG